MNPSKLKQLPLDVRQRWVGLTDEEKEAEIKKFEAEMTPELHAEIKAYVQELLGKKIKVRQIKKMVFKKFKVAVI